MNLPNSLELYAEIKFNKAQAQLNMARMYNLIREYSTKHHKISDSMTFSHFMSHQCDRVDMIYMVNALMDLRHIKLTNVNFNDNLDGTFIITFIYEILKECEFYGHVSEPDDKSFKNVLNEITEARKHGRYNISVPKLDPGTLVMLLENGYCIEDKDTYSIISWYKSDEVYV